MSFTRNQVIGRKILKKYCNETIKDLKSSLFGTNEELQELVKALPPPSSITGPIMCVARLPKITAAWFQNPKLNYEPVPSNHVQLERKLVSMGDSSFWAWMHEGKIYL